MRTIWWPAPEAGDIVWCHFPQDRGIEPGPKPRPALVMKVFDNSAQQFAVLVAYGTSQKTDRLYRGEFRITKSEHPAAYASAGISYSTKFDLGKMIDLPYNADYFSVPPHAPYGQTPQLGTLHPSMVRVAAAAYAACEN